MSITVNINGVTYTIPTSVETGWGNEVTSWINAASQGLLQKKGGTFTLTSDVDFGDNFGAFYKYVTTKTAAAAQTGVLRLANSDNIAWRNNANSGDIYLTVNSNDLLEFNGVEIVDSDTPQELKNKTIDCDQTNPDRNFILNCLLDIFEPGVVTTAIDAGSTDDQIATAKATKDYVDSTIVGTESGNTALVGEESTEWTFSPIVGWNTDIFFSVNNADKNINTIEAVATSTDTSLSFTPTIIRCSNDGDVICVANPTENSNQGIVQIFRISDATNVVVNGGAGEEAGKQIAVSTDGSLVVWSQAGILRAYDFSSTVLLATGATVTSYGDNRIFSRTNQIVTTSYDGANDVVVHRWDLSGTWSESTTTSTLTYNDPFIVSDPTYVYLNDSEEIIRYDSGFTPTSITSSTQDIVGGLGIDDAGNNLFTVTEIGDVKYFTQLLGTEENVFINVTPVTPQYLQGSSDGNHCALIATEEARLYSKDSGTWYAQDFEENVFCYGIDSTPFVTTFSFDTDKYVSNDKGYLLVDNDCLYIDGELTGSAPVVRTVVKDDIRNVGSAVGRFIIVRRVNDHTYWDNAGKYTINLGEIQQFGFIPYQRVSNTNDGYISSNSYKGWNNDLYTGITLGGDLSINAGDNTKFDLKGGTGFIVNAYDVPSEPQLNFVTWDDDEALTVTNIATSPVTYVYIDVNGDVIQDTVLKDAEDQRDFILLGTLTHPDLATISDVNKTTLMPTATPGQSFTDLARSLGAINTAGNIFSESSTNDLKFDKTVGETFQLGSNWFDNKKNPHIKTNGALTPVDNFIYTYKDATGWVATLNSSPNNDIDPDQYNVVNTGLVSVPAGEYQIQRIYLTSTNLVIVAYGQNTYASEADAIAAIASESYELNPDLVDVLLRSYLVVQQGTTDLSNSSFISAGKFGGETTSSASSATTTLQAAYDNSSRPQIELNGGGGFQLKDSSTPISDPLIEFNDDGETKTYFNVTPDGARKEVSIYEKIGEPSAPSSGFTKIYMDTNDHLVNKASSDINVKVGDDGDFNSGMSLQQPDPTISSDGATITLSLEAVGTGDIDYYIGEEPNRLDCTPPATVALTAGTSTSPAVNYIYVTAGGGGVGVLNASTTFPTGEFCWVGQYAVQDAVSVQTNGALSAQRFSDNVRFPNGRGIESLQREKIRVLGADWDSGVSTTVTITTNVGTPDNVTADTTAGIVYQLNRQNFPAFNNPGSDIYFVANDNATPYRTTTDLNTELTDALGGSMVGRSFNLVLWGAQNKSTGECKRFINLPLTSYASGVAAIIDSSNTTVTAIPSEFKKTGFLIARFVFTHSVASGGTWTNDASIVLGQNNIDLRGLKPGYNLNQASTPSLSEFSDGAFRVNDDVDSTKQFGLQCEDITTGTTRIVTVPDSDGTFVYNAFQATLTNKIYDGGTAGDATNRVLVPQTTSLGGLTGASGNLVYEDTEKKLYVGNGSSFDVVGGGLIPVEIDHTFGDTLETGKHYIVDLAGASPSSNTILNVEAGAAESIIRVSVYNISRTDSPKITLDPSGAETIQYDDVNYDSMELGQIQSDCWLVWDSGESYWVGVDGSEAFNGTFSGSLEVGGDFYVPNGDSGFNTDDPSDKVHVYNDTLRVGSATGDTSIQQNESSIRIAAIPNTSTEWGGIEWFREFSDVVGAQIIAKRDSAAETDTDLLFKTNSGSGSPSEAMRIQHTGRVGIGTDNPAYTFDLHSTSANGLNTNIRVLRDENNVGVRTAMQIFDSADVCGSITFDTTANTTSYNTSSDERLKKDLGTWFAIPMIENVNPKRYERHSNPGVCEYGFFAQELNKVLPQAVKQGSNDLSQDPWEVDYSKVTGVLWKAVQELSEEVKSLKKELAELKGVK